MFLAGCHPEQRLAVSVKPEAALMIPVPVKSLFRD